MMLDFSLVYHFHRRMQQKVTLPFPERDMPADGGKLCGPSLCMDILGTGTDAYLLLLVALLELLLSG